MDKKRAYELITENLPSIYGYAVSHLYDRGNVEDLTSEIVCEILESAGNLKDDRAFWGFAWKIAENTLRKFIRREGLKQRAEQFTDDFSSVETLVPSPEEEHIVRTEQDEQLYLIRRELSLLTKARREVTVAYYIHNKSCSQISKELDLSVEMVKYHLFKTRKQLKEGVNMTRQLGEKSYDPGVFRINFWGDWNHYNSFFDRKLRGSIVLAAYYAPMSAEELSVELGVSMPYLEEEIEALEAAGVLLKNGTKYQTNLVIITEEYEKEIERKTACLYPPAAKEIFEDIEKLLPEVRKLDFECSDWDDNKLTFALFNIAMVRGFEHTTEISPYGDPQVLKLGGHGWIWGHDNDLTNYHFRGVTMHTENDEGTAWFSAENYIATEPCQHYEHWRFTERAEAMWSAILGSAANERNDTIPDLVDRGIVSCMDGKLSASFPVFTQEVYDKLTEEILAPVYHKVADMMIKISDLCTEIMKDHAPASVRDQCAAIAKIHHRLDVGAILLERMIAEGRLTLPQGKVPLCIFGVKK